MANNVLELVSIDLLTICTQSLPFVLVVQGRAVRRSSLPSIRLRSSPRRAQLDPSLNHGSLDNLHTVNLQHECVLQYRGEEVVLYKVASAGYHAHGSIQRCSDLPTVALALPKALLRTLRYTSPRGCCPSCRVVTFYLGRRSRVQSSGYAMVY